MYAQEGQEHAFLEQGLQLIITSDVAVQVPGSYVPAVTLILPSTIDAAAPLSSRGRGARGVQVVAPGRRVNTEDVKDPPETTNACP